MIVYIDDKERSLYVGKSYFPYAFIFIKLPRPLRISKRNVNILGGFTSSSYLQSKRRLVSVVIVVVCGGETSFIFKAAKIPHNPLHFIIRLLWQISKKFFMNFENLVYYFASRKEMGCKLEHVKNWLDLLTNIQSKMIINNVALMNRGAMYLFIKHLSYVTFKHTSSSFMMKSIHMF
jgi:hypothetical protein